MRQKLTPVVKYLLIINGTMLLLTFLLQSAGVIDLNKVLGLFYFKSEYFNPFQIITHMFMHGGFIHLLFNMYALYLFGTILEKVMGAKRFLFFYLFTGLGAAALHTAYSWYIIQDFYNSVQLFIVDSSLLNFETLVNTFPQYFNAQSADGIIENWSSYNINDIRNLVNDVLQHRMNIPTVGASGAVFGLLLAFGVMFPDIPLMLFFVPIPIKAKYFVIGYGLLELFTGMSNFQGDNIAHFAHLGGMLFGFILLKIWYKGNLKQM
ncbi:MAG: rhomboid family intramembrane serine protease [Bacteroidota bacterium]|nr:rhomboid family intramembrane serine protease [Bacteroidota bacterium]